MAAPPHIDSSRYFCVVRLASFLNFTPERAVTSANVGRGGDAPSRRWPVRAPSRNERRLKGRPGKQKAYSSVRRERVVTRVTTCALSAAEATGRVAGSPAR